MKTNWGYIPLTFNNFYKDGHIRTIAAYDYKIQIYGQELSLRDKVVKMAESGQAKKHPAEAGQVVFCSDGTIHPVK